MLLVQLFSHIYTTISYENKLLVPILGSAMVVSERCWHLSFEILFNTIVWYCFQKILVSDSPLLFIILISWFRSCRNITTILFLAYQCFNMTNLSMNWSIPSPLSHPFTSLTILTYPFTYINPSKSTIFPRLWSNTQTYKTFTCTLTESIC